MSAVAPMTPQQHSKLSHTLSKILRHAATQLGLKLDSAGYAVVDDLLDLPMIRKLGFVNLQSLQYVVKECPKQRFSLISPNADQDGFAHWKIRANQGHNVNLAESLDIHALLTPITLNTPTPPFCIHGTTRAAFDLIAASGGLHQMQRTHIHFASEDFGSASLISGMRKDSQILIHVDIHNALRWAASHSPPLHLEFFQSANSVILTDGVKEYAGVLPTFLYSRVEQVVKGVRSELEWSKPSEQEWMQMFEQKLVAKANQPAAPSSSSSSSLAVAFSPAPAKKQQQQSPPASSSAPSAIQQEFVSHTPPPAKPSPWGPPASSRPPSDWAVPDRLKHIVNGTPAPVDPTRTVAAATSKAAPSPMDQTFDYLVVLDFEATCDDKNNGSRFAPSEIIEFPMVLINLASGKQEAEFHRYVTPVVNPKLTPFCTSLTGITQSMVSKENGASPFKQVYEAANEFLRQHGLLSEAVSSSSSSSSPKTFAFVTCGDWDLKTMLPSQLETTYRSKSAPAHFSNWINIKQLFNDFYNPKYAARGMTDMLNQLKLSLEGRHHSGIDDTRNIARICQRMLQDGAMFQYTNKRVKIESSPHHFANGQQQRQQQPRSSSSSLSNALNKNPRSRIQ